jgi:MoaE-MoaD fusion protein
MSVRVLFFAALREKIGRADRVMELAAGSTVRDLVRELEQDCREIVGARYMIAINRQYAEPATALREGDEVALIPPVSGG